MHWEWGRQRVEGKRKGERIVERSEVEGKRNGLEESEKKE